MFPRQRYHGPNRWDRDSGDYVRWAVRTLAQALSTEACRSGWRHASWQPYQRSRWSWRSEPRRSVGAPSRGQVSRIPGPPRRQPPTNGHAERRAVWQKPPRRPGQFDWRDRVLPRRGPPVATIKAPGWPRQEVPNKRQPRGFVPRGTLPGCPKGQPKNRGENLKAVLWRPR